VEGVRWLWLVCPATLIEWDDASWERLFTRHVQLARDAGALGVLPMALTHLAGLHIFEGAFTTASSLIEEASAITAATGGDLPPQIPVALRVFRGSELEALELIESSTNNLMRRGEGVGLTFMLWATAVLYNSLGRYEEALQAALEACADPDEQVFTTWAAVELIEAATRSGVPELAAGALERLSASTGASGSDWALGIEAQSRALMSDGQSAENLYRQALNHLSRTRIRVALARAHLLYGEWLRRQRRRIDAREQLRVAHQMFTTMGADAFAARSERELKATGETRIRVTESTNQLTTQEAHVARLASEGLSNLEIAAQLFISRHTVQYHLHKAFVKLGIKSRLQLEHELAAGTKSDLSKRQ
jgi:DNA-binding CsgD family transcriptional regulator